MTTDSPTIPSPLEGKMYLYKAPELLNHEMHGSLGISRFERPYDFAREARVLPVTLPEFTSAHMFYPIIFTDIDNPVPLVVVGASDDVNLFVEEDGQWVADAYIPAYVRCYPFALAASSDEQFAAVIDREAQMINDSPERPFFDGDKVTAETQTMIDFCGRIDAERKMAIEFGKRLNELGLLTGHQATRTPPDGRQEVLANYVAVDSSKLAELAPETLDDLLKKGYLACIFAHLFSLENWPRILERHVQKTVVAED